MAHIKSFRVTGLAGRAEPVERELDRHVNVFWGLNGSGKTTLLKILHAAMKDDASGIATLPFNTAVVDIHSDKYNATIRRTYSTEPVRSRRGVKSYTVRLNSGDSDLREEWDEEEVEIAAEWSTSVVEGRVPRSALSNHYEHNYLPISRVAEERRRDSRGVRVESWGRDELEISADEMFARQIRMRWADYSAKSNSQIREIQQKGLASVLAILFGGTVKPIGPEQITRLPPPEDAYDLVKNFLREQYIELSVGRPEFIKRYRQSPEHRQVVSEIEQVRRATGEVLLPQLEFQSVIDGMYIGNKHLRFPSRNSVHVPSMQVMIADKAIPLQSLSSGEKQLLQILLETLVAGTSTIMIDEPELSLHVDWQNRLVASMLRVNRHCQLLLATHSPEVQVDVDEKNVFEL